MSGNWTTRSVVRCFHRFHLPRKITLQQECKERFTSVSRPSETPSQIEGPPFVGALLRLTLQRVRDGMNDALDEAGFIDWPDGEWRVLSYPPPDGVRPSELARRAGMSPAGDQPPHRAGGSGGLPGTPGEWRELAPARVPDASRLGSVRCDPRVPAPAPLRVGGGGRRGALRDHARRVASARRTPVMTDGGESHDEVQSLLRDTQRRLLSPRQIERRRPPCRRRTARGRIRR